MYEHNNWSKQIKGTIKASKRAKKSSANLHNKAKALAYKYYGTSDLKALQPYQLDKVITWVTGMNPDKGKNSTRKAAWAHTKGKKYLNANAKTQRILQG